MRNYTCRCLWAVYRTSPRSQLAAGFDTVYVNQIGPDADGFFRCYAEDVSPKVRGGQA